MGFGKQATVQRTLKINNNGSSKSASARSSQNRSSTEPDLSKMRKFSPIDETNEERKARLIAKSMNVTFGIVARLFIIGAVGYFSWQTYIESGGVAIRQFLFPLLVVADLGRVIAKAAQKGTK